MKIVEYYVYYDPILKQEQLTTESISSTRGDKFYYITPDEDKILYNPIDGVFSLGAFVAARDTNPWIEQDITN